MPSARERGCRSIHFSHDVAPVAARASTGIDAKLFVDCVNVVNNELSHLHLCRDCVTKQVHPSSRWCFGPFFFLGGGENFGISVGRSDCFSGHAENISIRSYFYCSSTGLVQTKSTPAKKLQTGRCTKHLRLGKIEYGEFSELHFHWLI